MAQNKDLEEITKEMYLDRRLKEYGQSDYYPFHMPGHKRRFADETFPSEIDITEIDGFDNLHDAQEILKAAQERAAALYDAGRTYFCVNGSTCGLLSAISAAVPYGGKVLIARNCHRAVYHAAYLRQLTVEYLYPEINENGIQGVIEPSTVEEMLRTKEGIAAVVLTSPTFDGIVSDIRAIADIAHAHGIPLIVDEAHGAHFGLHPYFPQTAVRSGADVVIQSMHKTLPSLTQTSLVHLRSEYVKAEKLERFLGIYETSSPSYVLMAGMDRCVRILTEQGRELLEAYAERLKEFYRKAATLKKIRVVPQMQGKDPSKLLIFADQLGFNGKELYDILLKNYHLQPEMCSGSYVLAITSLADTDEGFERLFTALQEIERAYGGRESEASIADFIKQVYRKADKCLEPFEAWDKEAEQILLSDAEGRIAADFVNLYPPGIPLLVPGERITREMLENLQMCIERRLYVQGVDKCTNDGNLRIKVVN